MHAPRSMISVRKSIPHDHTGVQASGITHHCLFERHCLDSTPALSSAQLLSRGSMRVCKLHAWAVGNAGVACMGWCVTTITAEWGAACNCATDMHNVPLREVVCLMQGQVPALRCSCGGGGGGGAGGRGAKGACAMPQWLRTGKSSKVVSGKRARVF